MSQNEKKPKIYLAQLTEKDGKYGPYFSGMLGMTWVTMSKAKNGKWNLYVEQRDLDQKQDAAPSDDPFHEPAPF